MSKNCDNCKFYEFTDGYTCNNSNSEKYGQKTIAFMGCDEWQKRNAHTAEELKYYQSQDLDVKIAMSKARIRSWVDEFGEDGVYVSISGGKDSQVLAHLVKSMYPNVPLVFVNTGLEYDSVRKKAEEMADTILVPEIDFFTVIKEKGYPFISKEISDAVSLAQRGYKSGMDKLNGVDKNGNISDFRKNYTKWKFLVDAPFRLSDECCWINKKHPFKKYEHEQKRKPFLGSMACESSFRKTSWVLNGCNAFDAKRPISQPISFWTEQDILRYLSDNEIRIADVYGNIAYLDSDGMYYENSVFNRDMNLTTTGVKRTGCVYCGYGCHLNNDQRFVRLKEMDKRKYDYVMNGGEFDESGMWVPTRRIVHRHKDGTIEEIQKGGLGYKFVIDWLNEHGGLNIKY